MLGQRLLLSLRFARHNIILCNSYEFELETIGFDQCIDLGSATSWESPNDLWSCR